MNLKTKTPEEMAKVILKVLNVEDKPEAVLVEAYLIAMVKQHREDAVSEHLRLQSKGQVF